MNLFSRQMALGVLLAGSMAAGFAHAAGQDANLARLVQQRVEQPDVLETKSSAVSVQVQDGNVQLSGWLQHANDYQKVHAIVAAVPGVKTVSSTFKSWASTQHP
ncbi:hypothetical protein LPB72_09860 [Hydrogenophaga crassostreae]|uniref:BON domain-containing protein n=1 Tax=Hydrogenophaga crassostreae TaxID=1763535 RepID=A0A167HRB5_9BURK|nr:BON domain-containing protein [Hydrogenophaga crassostreae]AOW13343.1 hypothetical protein LPB072_11240 [Hydrogenophaga crassostreae]OAD41626.1 hypothetical protein LPB72_09860 [Hydrogenophaga crassostreae]